MRRIALLSLSLALAACGSSNEGTLTDEDGDRVGTYEIDGGETKASITDQDGTVTTLRAGEQVPVELPQGFSIAPGFKVLNNTHVERDGGSFVLLTLQGDAPVEEVIAFYRKQAEAAGIEVTVSIPTGESTTIAGEGKDGLAFSAMASRSGDKTAVQLTLTQGLK
ncbi:hypothetical protein [Erythrobacter mangrovi]|uniref:Uncharacterized protein n=1 Tax=Erythrobacter mangrovi TaxID=2739433 RepID=A0A7D3XY54_9SPHN|nr:hypothetical protein [Erythrobacter mangrovi]QKG70332.1 hypothetical protein HQR01_02520 [Erythrobacter mangrovi]